ncbi:hypothetical protein DT594_15685 [Halopseudomonas laoshanensis]|uniref:Uncharacterized protein n=1 Tax=Halopseudomonas laoshanensis TaxID=2268758 RepID=A0A7V7GQC7_9GAMM|nr:hypothetical protein [Halopseudomonas laoshanensis]KAA0692401.1 hypothetical protein DT594_15685 [Halopseudomonas laoshanensis]
MSIGSKALVSILLALLSSAPMANTLGLPHDQYMPDDLYAARQDKPDQMLFEVDSYRLTLGTEYRPNALPSPQSAGVWVFVQGRSLIAGSPVHQARIAFVDAGSKARPARLEPDTQTLLIEYPVAYMQTLMRLLDGDAPAFVQARFYGNGTIWADVHGGD